MASPRRRRASAGRRPLDQRTAAEAFAYPGIDPRSWLTFALVDQDDPIDFDPEYGPLISCTAQPGGNPLRCQLGMQVAGDGEGEFHPFVAGDTVIVALVGGNERTAVILARMPNARAPFPPNVAGQDTSKNAFGFVRRRTPFVQEQVGPWMVRDAKTEAFLSIDIKGNVTLRDGSKGALQLSPDAFGYQSGDASGILQLDLTGKHFVAQIGDARILLSATGASPDASAITVPGQLTIGTAATPAAEHVATTEGVVNLIVQVINALGVVLNALPPGPLTTAALGAILIQPAFAATAALGIVAAGAMPLLPPLSVAIAAALASGGTKPPGAPGLGQVAPGVGCANLLAG